MIRTEFTALVGCTAPIQLAGMGGMAAPPLESVSGREPAADIVRDLVARAEQRLRAAGRSLD